MYKVTEKNSYVNNIEHPIQLKDISIKLKKLKFLHFSKIKFIVISIAINKWNLLVSGHGGTILQSQAHRRLRPENHRFKACLTTQWDPVSKEGKDLLLSLFSCITVVPAVAAHEAMAAHACSPSCSGACRSLIRLEGWGRGSLELSSWRTAFQTWQVIDSIQRWKKTKHLKSHCHIKIIIASLVISTSYPPHITLSNLECAHGTVTSDRWSHLMVFWWVLLGSQGTQLYHMQNRDSPGLFQIFTFLFCLYCFCLR